VHLTVDTLGLPHGIHVTTADFIDRDGAIELAVINAGKYESVETVLAGSAYTGESFAEAIKGLVDAKVEVARRNEAHMFIVLPKRWIVERPFVWADNCRRLWNVCERRLSTFCQINCTPESGHANSMLNPKKWTQKEWGHIINPA